MNSITDFADEYKFADKKAEELESYQQRFFLLNTIFA
jgi:hypothetical protein